MEKGISYFFGYKVGAKNLAKLIKDAGFDSVITSADKRFNKENGRISYQIKKLKKYGLKPSSLHFTYNASELHYFWEEGKEGECLKKNLIKDVKIAKKYGFKCVVVHLFGKYSEIGEKRLKEVLDVCEKLNVPLAVENINDKETFVKTFENIKHKMLRFCYDSGHGNVFDKDFDYLSEYRDKLICLHLHDNNGKTDQHTITKYSGTIDWHKIAKILAKCPEVSLDYEILNRVDNVPKDPKQFLMEAYSQALELEKLIELYKTKE